MTVDRYSETRKALKDYLMAHSGYMDAEAEKIMTDALALLRAQEAITGETSDGYHTFNELYHHRAVLFSVIVANYPDRAWKAKKHHDRTMYDGIFIVGIETPDGQATYHYDIDPYWDMFKCRVLDNAPEWDGHTPAQAIERIGRLAQMKAQEARVMTLGEVRNWVNSDRVTREPVAIEMRGGVCAWIIDDEVREIPGEADLTSDLYGKTWRCWTSRPTEAEREATPWN
jgi:hypothetical protein